MVDPRISNITSGGTSVAPKDMSLKYPKGGDGLTVKQRMFVKIFTENEGRLTPRNAQDRLVTRKTAQMCHLHCC